MSLRAVVMWIVSGSISVGITNTSPRLTSREDARKYFCRLLRSGDPYGLVEPRGDIIWATVTERAVGSGGGRGPNELAIIETERTLDPRGATLKLYERAGLQTTPPL